jgi:preprotein translocase subunit SecB
VLADAVRDGNFPPLMLEPIDFGALYVAQQQQQEAVAGEPAGQA